MITSVVTDSVYQKIIDKETTHEAWEALKQKLKHHQKFSSSKFAQIAFTFSCISGEDVSTLN